MEKSEGKRLSPIIPSRMGGEEKGVAVDEVEVMDGGGEGMDGEGVGEG